MFGDDRLFENLVREGEGIENDSNKNVDEQEIFEAKDFTDKFTDAYLKEIESGRERDDAIRNALDIASDGAFARSDEEAQKRWFEKFSKFIETSEITDENKNVDEERGRGAIDSRAIELFRTTGLSLPDIQQRLQDEFGIGAEESEAIVDAARVIVGESTNEEEVKEAQAPFTKQEIQFAIGELQDKLSGGEHASPDDLDRWEKELERLEKELVDAPDEAEFESKTNEEDETTEACGHKKKVKEEEKVKEGAQEDYDVDEQEEKRTDTVSNDPSFERTVEKFSTQLEEAQLKEGQFSWHAGDTDEPIYSTKGHQETVYMLDDKGNKWQEDDYEGYGIFGGKDFYILLGEMNGLELSGAQTDKDETFYKDRDIAIKFAFGDTSDDDREGVKYPRFTTDPKIPYEELPNPRSHEGQGWYEEEEDDRDYNDRDYDERDDESKEVKEMALSGDKYTVRAQAFNRESGEPVAEPRDEVIDISSNTLFRNVKSLGDIEAAYERFWNDLNPRSKEIVKVSSVSPANADEAVTNETTIKEEEVDESYGSVYIEADLHRGMSREDVIKKLQTRYPDIGDEEAEKIVTAVEKGEDWPRRESVEKVEEQEEEQEEVPEQDAPDVDFGPLEVELEKMLGIPVPLTGSLDRGRYGNPRVGFSSENLIEHAGIFKAALKEVFVQSFSGGEVNEEGTIWWTVVLSFEVKRGGHNGVDIMRGAWYDTNSGEWTFEAA